MKKRIVLCADDYGQAHAISQSIIKLIQMGRVTATSCMVNMPLWQDHAKWLFPFYKQIDMGLHLNFTQGKPLSKRFTEVYDSEFFSLKKLLYCAFTHRLNKEVIEAECHAQIDCFADNLGFLPHFIDGHQNVHQFPVIREVLLAVYEKRLRRQHAYIRLINDKFKLRNFKQSAFKKFFIHATGTLAFKRLLKINHIPHNLSFSGFYSIKHKERYEKIFPYFLQEVSDKGLIVCHPGLLSPSSKPHDSIAKAKFAEYEYLLGGQFLMDCHEKGVVISKFR